MVTQVYDIEKDPWMDGEPPHGVHRFQYTFALDNVDVSLTPVISDVCKSVQRGLTEISWACTSQVAAQRGLTELSVKLEREIRGLRAVKLEREIRGLKLAPTLPDTPQKEASLVIAEHAFQRARIGSKPRLILAAQLSATIPEPPSSTCDAIKTGVRSDCPER